MFGFGGPKETPAQQAKRIAAEGKREIRGETRSLDKDIRKIHAEEDKLKKQIEVAAKAGNTSAVQTLAKQLVQSRKAAARLEKVQGTLSNTSSQLTCAAASASSVAAVASSAKIMKQVGGLVDVAEIAGTMESMKREMAKAEMADELIDEGFAGLHDEDEVDAEMAKVFDDLELDAAIFMATPGAIPAYMAPPAGYAAATAAPQAPDPLAARLVALQAA